MANNKELDERRLKAKANDIINNNLPPFCKTYFIGREARLSGNSTLSYAYELDLFFQYLINNNSYFKTLGIQNIKLEDLDKLEATDIEEFLHWLRYHKDENNVEHTNSERSVEKYLSCLNKFWDYFHKRNQLNSNPIILIDRIKPKKKKIIRLESKIEEGAFLDSVMHGKGLSERELAFHQKSEIRDTAIIVLFLHTGLRVSEIRNINIQDLNFDEHYVGVYRKGNKYAQVYFSDYAESFLKEWLDNRKTYHPRENEDALFISNRGTRICVKQIENMVKKYAKAGLAAKGEIITPHKLRATYLTNVIKETGNIRLAQELADHENIQTTTFYTDIDEQDKINHRNLLQ